MSRFDRQIDDLVRRGRLTVAPSERVLEELERYGDLLRTGERLYDADEELEQALLNRSDPEIDLSLARNAGLQTTLKVLYTRASVDPTPERPEAYLKALRLAVLSNVCGEPSALIDFPKHVVDDGELRRIAEDEDRDPAVALFTNIRIDEDLIIALLKNEKPFDGLDDLMRRDLIGIVGGNPRWWTQFDGYEMPDMYIGKMYEAVAHLLRKSPIDDGWLITLYQFVSSVSPSEGWAIDDSIEDVLERWKDFSPETPRWEQGFATSLSLVDEFRCRVAAQFPRYSVQIDDGKNTVSRKYDYVSFGVEKSKDPAYRAAHYATCELSEKYVSENSRGTRDGVFDMAVLCNINALPDPKIRKVIEEECVAHQLQEYAKRLKQHTHSDLGRGERLEPLTDFVREELKVDTTADGKNSEISALAQDVAELRNLVIAQQQTKGLSSSTIFWLLFVGGFLVVSVLT